jgi:hypothetical protein
MANNINVKDASAATVILKAQDNSGVLTPHHNLDAVAIFAVNGANATTLTRPANVTAYSANDSISDNAIAGNVSALPITVSSTNDWPIAIERLRFITTDTGIAGKNMRAWLYNSDPTANSGVQAGDNVAFSNKSAGYIGTMSGLFRAMQNGAVVTLVPDEGGSIKTLPGSGAKTIWYQLQTLDAFTPSANSMTFAPTLEGYQGHA